MKTFTWICKVASDAVKLETIEKMEKEGGDVSYLIGRYSVASHIRDKVASYGIIRRFLIKILL